MQQSELLEKNILVVEDDFINIFLVKNILAEFSEIHFAKTTTDFRREISHHYFKVILMDIELGAESETGIDLLNFIRASEQHKLSKVYAITGLNNHLDEKFYLDLGFDGLFTKPLDKLDLVRSVYSIVNINHQAKVNQ